MSQLFAPGLAVTDRTVIRKRRELPLVGRILKQLGETVFADDVVGVVELPGDLRIVRVSKELGLPPHEILKVLQRQVGDKIRKGELLAELKGFFGLFSSRVVSPTDGVIEFVTEATGNIGVRMASKSVELCAHISGRIVDQEVGRSVTIETEAAFVQGIFGVGDERRGTLRVLSVEPSRDLVAEDLPERCAGEVIVGGRAVTKEFLDRAIEYKVAGIITGSIDDQTLKSLIGFDLGVAVTGNEKIPLTLIVTEGFGRQAISQHVLQVLRPLNGQQASINGATQVRAGALRPEVVVPLTAIGAEQSLGSPDLGKILELGSKVRIIRYPYFGEFGTVTELPVQPVRIATGAEVRVVQVRVGDQQRVVPRANIEVL